MALLERVSTLVRANLNDLIHKAEEPEKMIEQVILDMQNQLLQVKTQVAIAIADRRLPRRKAERKRRQSGRVDAQGRTRQSTRNRTTWPAPRCRRVEKYPRDSAESFSRSRLLDQKAQVGNLKSALRQLEQKLAESAGQGRSCSSRSTAAPAP